MNYQWWLSDIILWVVSELASCPPVDVTHDSVETVVEYGYYEEPRLESVADVADELGCSPGTAAEHLRRAEASVMTDVVSGRD
jgi:hypothetical protein